MHKKLFLFTWVAAAVISNHSIARAAKYVETEASECTNVDFRNTFPMKIRNQGEVAWCYANAAADYLQYTYELPTRLSAADIAINYAKSDWSKLSTFFNHLVSSSARGQPAQTGFIKGAIKRILPQGYCPEESFPSDFWNRVDGTTQASEKQEILQSIMDTYSLQEQVSEGVIETSTDLPFSFQFKNIGKEDFFNLLQSSTHKTILENLRQAACKGDRKAFPAQSISMKFEFKNKHIFEGINASFDRNMPSSIDFFASMFDDVNSFKKSIDELHTVLLYGRSYDPVEKECVYLLKNSYGDACDGYDPSIICDHGFLWIPEHTIYKALTSNLVITKD